MIQKKRISRIILLLILLFTYQVSIAETDNLEEISTLIQKTEKLIEEDKYEEALQNEQEVLLLRSTELIKGYLSIIDSLNRMARICYYAGAYKKAEPLYKQIIEICETRVGYQHAIVGISLNNYGQLYLDWHDYKKAEELFNKALLINEETLGPEDPSVATVLNSLGALYMRSEKHTKAEPLFKRALNIYEKTYGPEYIEIATTLNNMASMYKYLDNYETAEELYRKALAIRKKHFGTEHIKVALILNNLASFYHKLGNYEQAEILYEKALIIFENKLKDDHPLLAKVRDNLAVLYSSKGENSKAEQLYMRALTTMEKFPGPDHIDTVASLNNLGIFYINTGKYSKANQLLNRALKITIKALGSENIRVASIQNSLALIYNHLGEYEKAQEYYEKSLILQEKIFGSEHSTVSDYMIELASFYAGQGDLIKAHKLFMRAQRINNKLIDHVIGFSSGNRKLKYLASQEVDLHITLNFLFQPLGRDLLIKKDILNVWLKRKGIVLDAQKQYYKTLFYSDNKQISQSAMELSKVISKLSKLTFSIPREEDIKTYKNEIAQLENQKEELEDTLAKLSKPFLTEQKKSNVSCTKVAQAMPLNTVLVDFARINKYDFGAKGNKQNWLVGRYIAFIIHAGNGDKIDWIDLGPADEIDNEILAFRKTLAGVNTDMTKAKINILKKLHSLVFQPIKSKIGNTKDIFISPDGDLSLLPFEVLINNDGKFLIEDYTFNYLSAGRDILGFGEAIEGSNKSLVIGNPDFNMDSDHKKTIIEKLGLKTHKEKRMAKRSKDLQNSGTWQSLPGTQDEVQTIYNLIGKDKAELFTGKKAMEETLMYWGVPKILHLATHGFFLENRPIDFKSDNRISRGFSPQPETDQIISPSPIYLLTENPLLRSGIVLAGANKLSNTNDDTIFDGIVTSEEILGMNLRGTEMVVLSACDTGLGEVKNGEGVFGLRRAFTQAGTKSLVMSMWKVPDKETKELMVNFYSNIYRKGMNRCQALRQATLKQMRITERNHYGKANPYYWGAFVFMGER